MPARQTRKRAAKARDGASSSDDDNRQVSMNGNGLAHKASEDSDSALYENIFLFWPNIIGMPPVQLQKATAVVNSLLTSLRFSQATAASCSPLLRFTTCLYTPAPVPCSTASPAYSTPSMATPPACSSSRPASALSLTWSPTAAPRRACWSSCPRPFRAGPLSSRASLPSTFPATTCTCTPPSLSAAPTRATRTSTRARAGC